tara:strand:- start:146 stop:595 length:450 start_codon:yes stop_codon:yes gene_type:complete
MNNEITFVAELKKEHKAAVVSKLYNALTEKAYHKVFDVYNNYYKALRDIDGETLMLNFSDEQKLLEEKYQIITWVFNSLEHIANGDTFEAKYLFGGEVNDTLHGFILAVVEANEEIIRQIFESQWLQECVMMFKKIDSQSLHADTEYEI